MVPPLQAWKHLKSSFVSAYSVRCVEEAVALKRRRRLFSIATFRRPTIQYQLDSMSPACGQHSAINHSTLGVASPAAEPGKYHLLSHLQWLSRRRDAIEVEVRIEDLLGDNLDELKSPLRHR